jgi:hypothetical protein
MTNRISLGHVDSSELERVFDTLWPFRTSDESKGRITVFAKNGRRHWHLVNRSYAITIVGDHCEFTGAYSLPLTAVANVGRQVGSLPGGVEFVVENDRVTSITALGTQTVPCSTAAVPEVTRVRRSTRVVRAKVGGKELRMLVLAGAGMPFEFNPFRDENSSSPDSHLLEIGDDSITVSSDWTCGGLYDMTARVAAVTHGKGQLKMVSDFVDALATCSDPDAEWTLAFDLDDPTKVFAWCPTFHVMCDVMKSPVSELRERVQGILEREKMKWKTTDIGQFHVLIDEITVRVTFLQHHDSDESLMRLDAVLEEDANESVALLREINAHNASGNLTRMWHDHATVMLGIDLTSENLGVFEERLNLVASEAKRLRGLLSPLAAESALPPRRKKRTPRKPDPANGDTSQRSPLYESRNDERT